MKRGILVDFHHNFGTLPIRFRFFGSIAMGLEALSFLVEVDEMIHASMLGEGFERRVTDQCDVLRVFSEIRGTWQPYAVVVFAGLLVPICLRVLL